MATTYYTKNGNYYKKSGGGVSLVSKSEYEANAGSSSTTSSGGSTSSATGSNLSTPTYSSTGFSNTSSSTSSSPQYVTFQTANGPAYFQKTSSGLSAINDPNVLRELQAGALAAQPVNTPSGQTFSTSVASPNLVPKTSVPTRTDAISSPTQPFTLPSLTPDSGNIAGAIAGTAGAGTYQDSINNFYQQQADRTQQMFNEQKSSFQELMSSMLSPGEARSQAEDRIDLDAAEHFAEQKSRIKEVETLTKEYNNVVAQRDAQIAQAHDKLASNNFINNQIAQINRNAAPELNRISADINAKAAIIQAMDGNFAEAQRYINQAVADATADAKFKADMWNATWEMNFDAFNAMEGIYSSAFETQMSLVKMEYDRQYAEKQQIGELLLAYPSAGIDIYNDTWEDAMRKAGLAIPAGGFSSSGSLSGISSRTNQLLDGFITLSQLTPSEQAKVRDQLYELGFGSDTPPQWYVDFLENSRQQSLLPNVVQDEWNTYKEKILSEGGSVTSSSISFDEL